MTEVTFWVDQFAVEFEDDAWVEARTGTRLGASCFNEDGDWPRANGEGRLVIRDGELDSWNEELRRCI